jgi:hypothetical protein
LPPVSPSPRSFSREPVSTPAGMRTFRVWVRRSVPDPRHSVHGFVITVPCPLQVPHVLAMAKNPCWKRIWPEPRHCWQVAARVPGCAPLPLQVAHGTCRGMESVFSHPRAASSKDAELVLEILTAPRPGATAASAAGAEEIAEQIAEDVLEPGAEIESAEAALLERRVSEAIVGRAALAVAQHLVRFADLLEAVLGGPVAGILVRVILEGELAVGLLQVLIGGRPLDSEHLVVVTLHRSPGR